MSVPIQSDAKTFVLVHGAGHGGWCYDRVATRLREEGHRVFTPTLSGVAERLGENAGRTIDLSTHVRDVLGLFDVDGIENAYLCGHSYGGMVISGVAEQIPERIHNLVFIDSVVPENGDRMTDFVFPGWRYYGAMAAVALLGRGKMLIAPPAKFFAVNEADRKWVDERLTAHPMASLREPIRISGNADRIPHHTYIYGTEWGFAPITKQFEKAKERAGWKVFEVNAGHDIMIDAPERLSSILSSLE